MTDRLHPPKTEGDFRDGLHSGAGALRGRNKTSSPAVPVSRTPATEEWVNEGGSAAPASSRARTPSPSSTHKALEDSISGCRERAAADLSHAAMADTENARLRYQNSAASWAARAGLLQALGTDSEAQRAADRALWAKEERTSPTGPGIDPEEANDVRL